MEKPGALGLSSFSAFLTRCFFAWKNPGCLGFWEVSFALFRVVFYGGFFPHGVFLVSAISNPTTSPTHPLKTYLSEAKGSKNHLKPCKSNKVSQKTGVRKAIGCRIGVASLEVHAFFLGWGANLVTAFSKGI